MNTRHRRPFTAYESTVELEFRVGDDRCFLVAASGRADCELVLDEAISGSTGTSIQFVSVYDGATGGVLAAARSHGSVEDARVVASDDDADLVELVVSGRSLATTVADCRAVPRHVSADRGTGRVVVEVPPSTAPQAVIDVVVDRLADVTLVARREHDPGPALSSSEFRERVLADLTDRQREALRTAHEAGYFATPRRTTASDCAATLGISQSTFSQHLGVALEKVVGSLLDPS
jgi:predicted DNA binding protein